MFLDFNRDDRVKIDSFFLSTIPEKTKEIKVRLFNNLMDKFGLEITPVSSGTISPVYPINGRHKKNTLAYCFFLS